MKDLSKKIVEAEFLPLDPYRATKEDVLSEDTFRYLNAIENEFFKESILLKVRDIAKNLGVKDETCLSWEEQDEQCKKQIREYETLLDYLNDDSNWTP